MSRNVTLAALLALVGSLMIGPAPGPSPALGMVDPDSRTIAAGPFVVRWSLYDPEAITYLSWNDSVNLTNTWVHPSCPDGGISEFFGNGWGTSGAELFVAPVGWGSTGQWTAAGTSGVDITSAATTCYGTSGIPVTTSYRFLGTDTATGRIEVERRFAFGATAFTADLRPYIPRLGPRAAFSQILYPGISGSSLVTHSSVECGNGCRMVDWNGTWFAIHDPQTGRGMVVRHEASSYPAALWIDDDGGSDTTSTSTILLQTGLGFTGTVVDRQTICFYDNSLWAPSLTPPISCSGPWSGMLARIASKLGVASTPGAYTATTKVAAIGRYVTWQAALGPDAAGKPVAVLAARKNADGTWTAFSRVTSRVADAAGVVTYSRRETGASWISLRMAVDSIVSTAVQARWR